MEQLQMDVGEHTDTQRNKILKALLRGEKLTQLDMLIKFGAGQSGTRIFELRRMGYDIITRYRTRGRKRFAEYSIPPKSRHLNT